MKRTKRNQLRCIARAPRQVVTLRYSLESKLLKVCTDIGGICGRWEGRLEPAPSARRSSRKRIMLGRALIAEAKMQEGGAFHPVESSFVSSGRTAYIQTESVAEAASLSDFAFNTQGALARLERMGISASEVVEALGDARVHSFGRQRWEQRRSLL